MFPRVPIFDLDGTWWCPDMYELWGGGGAPFRRISGTDSAMIDKGKNTVQLLGGTMRLVSELWHYYQHYSPAAEMAAAAQLISAPSPSTPSPSASSSSAPNHSTSSSSLIRRNTRSGFSSSSGGAVPFIIAAASTCDEPRWAQELLHLFHTRPYPFDKPVLIHDHLEHKPQNSNSATQSSSKKGNKMRSSFEDNSAERSGDDTAIHVPSGDAYGGGGVVSFKEVLGQFDEIYKANKRAHMANILQKFRQNKMSFVPCAVSVSTPSMTQQSGKKKEFFVPPIFAAALPQGTAVCPQTGLVTFTDPSTEEALRRQLEEEDSQPISYKDFIFFDNQMNNIHDVSRDNITSVYVPEGMTMSNWEKGLRQWRREQRGQPEARREAKY